MSCFLSFSIPKALPLLSPHSRPNPLSITSDHEPFLNYKLDKKNKIVACSYGNSDDIVDVKKYSLAVQLGALLATIEQPALALTGVNNEEDITTVLIQLAIVAFWYFIIMPPIILNWCRTRWFRRKFLEMFLQLMFVFIFFPGLMLWAPFVNFRSFPRDPTLKYPWSTPENPSQVPNIKRRYPWATPEDYE